MSTLCLGAAARLHERARQRGAIVQGRALGRRAALHGGARLLAQRPVAHAIQRCCTYERAAGAYHAGSQRAHVGLRHSGSRACALAVSSWLANAFQLQVPEQLSWRAGPAQAKALEQADMMAAKALTTLAS